jgi:hypothetical protein
LKITDCFLLLATRSSKKVEDQDSGNNLIENINENIEKETNTKLNLTEDEQTVQNTKITKSDGIENRQISNENLPKTDVAIATKPLNDLGNDRLNIDHVTESPDNVTESTESHVTDIKDYQENETTVGHVESHMTKMKGDPGTQTKNTSEGAGGHVAGSADNHHADEMMKKQTQTNPKLPDLHSQRKLTTALRFACKALPWQHIRDQASSGVTSVNLSRALTWRDFSAGDLVQSLVNLRELDISNNVLGPQGFRIVCLGVAHNKRLTSLNLANNLSDTESSVRISVGIVSRFNSLFQLEA